MPSSRESSGPRDWTQVSCISCIGRRILYHCTTESGLTSLMNFQPICWPGLQSSEGLNGDGRSPSKMLLLFSHSIMSDSLQLHRPQHASLPCPSLICSTHVPGICSSSFHWVSEPTISSSHLCLLPSVFPSISVFSSDSPLHIRWPKYWSFSFSISLPMNIQGWFPLRLADLFSLLSKGLSRVLQYHSLKALVLWHSAFFMIHLSLPYMTTGNTIALTVQTFPRWLTHMTGKLMVSVCRRPQFLPIVGFSIGLHREAGFLQSKLIQRRTRRKLLYPSWLRLTKKTESGSQYSVGYPD